MMKAWILKEAFAIFPMRGTGEQVSPNFWKAMFILKALETTPFFYHLFGLQSSTLWFTDGKLRQAQYHKDCQAA